MLVGRKELSDMQMLLSYLKAEGGAAGVFERPKLIVA
jgi:hypothetical protein